MNKKTDNQVIDVHIQNIAKTLETIGRVSKQAQESHLRIAETLGPTIKKAVQDLYSISDFFEKHNSYWQNFQQQYEITEQDAIGILKKHQWFITYSMPFDFVHRVVEIGKTEGDQRANIDELFKDYFTINNFENLDGIVKGWGAISIFEPRMNIFKDCIATLRDSRNTTNPSNLIVPTLIAQIDGIQAEFMELNGFYFESKKWRDENGDQINIIQQFEKQTLNCVSTDWSDQELINLFNYIFLDILLQGSWRGDSVSFPFSRHKIMHGEHIDYGIIDNTIRAFMILDYLATLTNRTLSQQQ